MRRAFTYVAGEQWGIVRVGQGDGLISIFDNGITTFQFTPTGNLNGGDLQNMVGGTAPAFVFLGQAGDEYDNAKAVYLSPQIAGFDFGIQYAPNTSNGNGIGSANIAPLTGSLNGSGTGTGNSCGTVNTGCPTLSSGPGVQDGSRSINQAAIGARYQGQFGATGLLAYVVGEGSQHADYTGGTAQQRSATSMRLDRGRSAASSTAASMTWPSAAPASRRPLPASRLAATSSVGK